MLLADLTELLMSRNPERMDEKIKGNARHRPMIPPVATAPAPMYKIYCVTDGIGIHGIDQNRGRI